MTVHSPARDCFSATQAVHAAPNGLGLDQVLPTNGKRKIAAHSLGNIVVSNAIAEFGLEVDHYLLFNAAVALEAYDPGQQYGHADEGGGLMAEYMTHRRWRNYPEALYASDWHTLFEDDDPRSEFTWRGRFSSVLPIAHHFYSPGEEVLENPEEDQGAFGALWDSMRANGTKAWVAQELFKGCSSVQLISRFTLPVCTGGWGFNSAHTDLEYIGVENPDPDHAFDEYRRMNASQAMAAWDDGTLTEEHQAQFGVFHRFQDYDNKDHLAGLYAPIANDDERLASRIGSVADAQALASETNVLWEQLAGGIPALSYPAGGNPIDALELIEGEDDREDRNYNYQALRCAEADVDEEGVNCPWPQSRLSSDFEDRWLHSDIRNIALPYIAPVFDIILEIGED